MKTSLKSAFIALSLAILAAFTFSNCATSSSAPTSGTHDMGAKPGYQMQNKDMPSRN